MRHALILGCAFLLAGCDPPPPSKPLDESQNPPEQVDTGPSGAAKYAPIEKAKRVEAQVLDQKDQQDKQIDQQEGH
jgi:hypothetical protein